MDDIPVVGESGADPPGPPVRRSPRLYLGLGAVAAVTAGMLAIGGGEAPAIEAEVSVPVLTVPPTVPEPRLVNRTLEWSPVTGLGEIESLVGVADLEDRVVAVATIAGQVQVFATDDGLEWEPGAVLGPASPWPVMIDLGDRVGVVLNRSDVVAGDFVPDFMVSSDGEDWEAVEFPLPDGLASATIAAGVAFDDGLVIGGWAGAYDAWPGLWETLPAPVGDLVASGAAWMDPLGTELDVRLGEVVIYSRPLEGAEREMVTSSTQRAAMWRGAPGRLDVVESSMVVPIGVLDDGRLVAHAGGSSSLVASVDGEDWALVATGLEAWQAHVWKDLIVGPSADGSAILSWAADTEQMSTLTPEGLPSDGAWPQRISSGGAGLAALFLSPAFVSFDEEVAVSTEGDLDWVLTEGRSVLEVRRGAEVVGRAYLWETTGSLTDAGLSIELADQVLVIGPDEWIELTNRSPLGSEYSARVLHTVDGLAWSLTTAPDLAGPTLREPVVFVTDEFVLLTEQRPDDTRAPGQAWVGHPVG